MPTVPSWAEPAAVGAQVADVGHLLRFRAATVRRRRAAAGFVALLVATAAAIVLPALVADEVRPEHLDALVDGLPAGLAGFVALAVASAVAVGGGRELLARDPAAIHPIGPVTDHLGALVLAPMSAAWLLPAWALLAAVSLAIGSSGGVSVGQSVPAIVLTLLWMAAATTLGQLIAWTVEWVRRGPRGVLVVRLLLAGLVAVVAGAALQGAAVDGPATWVAGAILGREDPWLPAALLLLAAGLFLVAGAAPAAAAGRRTPRDETRLESGTHRARADVGSDHRALVRVDRASVWRSLPLRRGTYLLAIAPGLFALAAGMDWQTLTVLPGLVASGCVLLFGVNVWCLDGHGALWRASLPVSPSSVFVARTRVVVELLLGAGCATLVLGALRAGTPEALEVVTALLVLLVVTGQAVSGGMRWSERAPYAVDLRSARATPAPPLVMIGYSVRLAFATTLTAVLLAGLAVAGRPTWLLAAGALLLAVSVLRIERSRRRWLDPQVRARVVATVAA